MEKLKMGQGAAPARGEKAASRGIRAAMAVLMGGVCIMSAPSYAQDGEALYKQRCAVCHTVGEGRLAGPDLKDMHVRRSEDWLVKFIKSPQSVIDSGDADAKAMLAEYKIPMPNQDLSDAEVKAVIAYVAAKSGGAAGAAKASPTQPAARAVGEASETEVLAGQDLFTGKQRLSNGGAACISCHAVNHPALKFGGGQLAANVTESYGRMGDSVKGLIAQAPFPAMAAAYKNHPITDDEAYQLAAFLKSAGEAKGGPGAGSNKGYLGVGGGIGFLAVLGAMNVIWSRRKKLSTKHDILERQSKTH